jgi:hypothetical protein
MNRRGFLKTFFLSAVLIFICPLYAAESLVFDSDFFKSLSRMSTIERDIYLDELPGRIIIGRGTILTIVERENYKKNFRIEVSAGESSRYRLKFLYYVYFDDKNIIELLSENSSFEFKGQLMGITPVNSQRSEFILDIVFMEGSTIIQ